MIKQHRSPISLATLILCLCLGSMVFLPFTQISPSAPEIFGVGAENYNQFDQSELDDDFFVISIVGAAIAELSFSKSGTMNLDFQFASLSPVSPPPKSS
jgi:hypothetical protein